MSSKLRDEFVNFVLIVHRRASLLSMLNCGIPLSDDGPSRFHDSALVSLGVFPVQR